MHNTLIVKKGAAGDVVRTTSLLNVLEGNVYWIVDPANRSIFQDNHPALHILTPSEFQNTNLRSKVFDLVLSLEEDEASAQLVNSITAKELIGVYLNHDGLTYTPQSSGWYDMSLISKKGRSIANGLKKSNSFPFQHWLFNMVGHTFSNQPYMIYRNPIMKKTEGLIGIEKRVGDTWPNKSWKGYESLAEKIRGLGYQVKFFEQRKNLRDYFDDIATCSCIISGDSLPMHVAMAYQIPCIALFNCTPPGEIHDYGYLTKIVNPLLDECLYERRYSQEVVGSIKVDMVFDAFKRLSISK